MSNDIVDYKIPFVRNGVDVVRFFGMPSLSLSFFKQTRHFLGLITSLSPATLTITDARENPPDYATCGFKLAPMATEITDWDDKAQLEAYKAEVEALALELHPLARRFVWMDFLKRGGQGNNKPAVDGPHLDYYQDWHAAMSYGGHSSPDEEPDVVLGVWRPVLMKNPVLDYPFVYMDASTFKPEDQVRFEQEFSLLTPEGRKTVKNLAAHSHHREGQRWYYHSEQTCGEALLFTHYTKGKFRANVHCAVKREMGAGLQTRQSLENRLMIFYD
ncbi:hypothetical protein TrCOL_g11062 [Triparma columacea]|uniref:Uncharacterized protein n=1 Tax=Triparma columacea TaxID=722753 RepID=A0A9W7L8M5_9STRA|nr:hypothetical protein TrCOL_g11062 [Triparma columacea]